MKKSVIFALFIGTIFGFIAESAFATPYCSRCPYSCSDLGLGRKDCSEIEASGRSCCVDLTQRGLDVARAFENRDNSRDQQRPRRDEERCPAGFSPSERKCSPDERRRGCKDIRLNSGLGCVSR
jgi:hypothetical protein